MRPYKVFLAASLPTLIAAKYRLYLRHYCRLYSLSHRTTCGITAGLSDLYTAHGWAVVTSMPSYIFIVALMPLRLVVSLDDLRHHCRLGWSLYCSSMSSCNFHVILYLYSGIDATSTLRWDCAAMTAVWDHTRSFLRHHCRLWLRHHADFTCGITADSIRCLIGRLAASLPTCVIFILLIDEQLWLPCRLISL
jgi:hypothetical protein